MDKDYRILGLAPGADKKEVKRAYFKLVRQFSPEKDPERFQEIRGAYERLTQEEDAPEKLNFKIPDEPFAKAMLQQIQELAREGNYEKAAATAEEAMKYYGELEVFLYHAAECQRNADHSGKAVRYYEKLCRAYPDKLYYQEQLATAYMGRGFGIKAYNTFEKAYQAGSRDPEFMLSFSVCCKERECFERGMEILWELIRRCTDPGKEQIMDCLEAYTGLIMLDMLSGQAQFSEIAAHFLSFLKSAGRLLKGSEEEILSIARFLVSFTPETSDYPMVDRILDEIKRRIPGKSFAGQLEELEEERLENYLRKDKRLGEGIEACYHAYIEAPEVYDDTIIRFTQLEARLILIEQWPQIRQQTDIVKAEYPALYEKIRDFVELLESGQDMGYLKEKYLKEYDRLEKNISGGRYYELYPQNRPTVQEKMQWNSADAGAFVRSGKKVGRNEPCPCGSGKKYKNCCGRN